MVRIRLSRYGRKNKPSYRFVVADQDNARDGKFIEQIGYYNPTENPDPKSAVIKKDRYDYWLSVGAQPSTAVTKILSGKYVYEKYDRTKKVEEPAEATPVVETPVAETSAPKEEAKPVEEPKTEEPKADEAPKE